MTKFVSTMFLIFPIAIIAAFCLATQQWVDRVAMLIR
jgi:hypothetical protein